MALWHLWSRWQSVGGRERGKVGSVVGIEKASGPEESSELYL